MFETSSARHLLFQLLLLWLYLLRWTSTAPATTSKLTVFLPPTMRRLSSTNYSTHRYHHPPFKAHTFPPFPQPPTKNENTQASTAKLFLSIQYLQSDLINNNRRNIHLHPLSQLVQHLPHPPSLPPLPHLATSALLPRYLSSPTAPSHLPFRNPGRTTKGFPPSSQLLIVDMEFSPNGVGNY